LICLYSKAIFPALGCAAGVASIPERGGMHDSFPSTIGWNRSARHCAVRCDSATKYMSLPWYCFARGRRDEGTLNGVWRRRLTDLHPVSTLLLTVWRHCWLTADPENDPRLLLDELNLHSRDLYLCPPMRRRAGVLSLGLNSEAVSEPHPPTRPTARWVFSFGVVNDSLSNLADSGGDARNGSRQNLNCMLSYCSERLRVCARTGRDYEWQ
jgi:hypothetical protein